MDDDKRKYRNTDTFSRLEISSRCVSDSQSHLLSMETNSHTLATFPTNTPHDTRRHGGLISSPTNQESRTSFVCSPEKKTKNWRRGKLLFRSFLLRVGRTTLTTTSRTGRRSAWWVLSVNFRNHNNQSRARAPSFPRNDPNDTKVCPPGRFQRAVNTSIDDVSKNSEKVKLPGRATDD